MADEYSHVVWVQELLAQLDEEQDKNKKAELILRGRDYFNALSPPEKGDIFIYLLGRNRTQ